MGKWMVQKECLKYEDARLKWPSEPIKSASWFGSAMADSMPSSPIPAICKQTNLFVS